MFRLRSFPNKLNFPKTMINLPVAKIFYEISEYLAMDEVAFKPQAFEKAARVLEELSEDAAEIYERGGIKELKEIPGIGESLAEKIEEYIKTGKIKYHAKLKKKCPVDLEHLTAVEGVGPKSIKVLYEKLGVKNLADLEKAAKEGEIEKLPRFGKKIQENILRGIEFVKGGQGRMLLGFALPLARKIEKRLRELPGVSEAALAGSLRRRKETIGDFDFLAVSKDKERVMDYFCSMIEVEKIIAKGETRSSVRLHLGLDADLRVVESESFGSALQYFTGSKDHNIKTRQIAQDKKLKLNEYGVFRGQKRIAGKTEKEVYAALSMEYIEPEMRENRGEIELSLAGKLPNLVELKDIKGDLQMHSTWSDGAYTIKEMAQAAQKLGHEYIAITDHAGSLHIAHALSPSDIKKQWQEIDKLNKTLKGIKILKGIEVDLDDQGQPELPEEILAKFDLVLGSIHSKLRMSKIDITKRLVVAAKNPLINILAHPTGRLIGRREEMAMDLDEILKAAAENGTVMEINAYPERLDLNDQNIKKAIEAGVLLSIGTDAHSVGQLEYFELGVFEARRGWAEKKNIINTKSYKELMEFLKK